MSETDRDEQNALTRLRDATVQRTPWAYDTDWHERIERAKHAREEGKKAREDKPVAFTTSRVRI